MALYNSGTLTPVNYGGGSFGGDWFMTQTQGGLGSETDVIKFSGTVRIDSLLGPIFAALPDTDNHGAVPHIALVVNATGAATHIPGLVAHGEPLWNQGRGFYFCRGQNQAYAEHWQGGGVAPDVWLKAPGIDTPIASFNSTAVTTVHFNIRAGHRAGTMANKMELELRNGGPSGSLLFKSSVPWGWDRGSGAIRCGIGYICPPVSGTFVQSGAFTMNASL